MLIVANGTVYAQSTIPDSCICYTDIQDMRCLECLINASKKDSLIAEHESFIKYQEATIYKSEAKSKKRKNFAIGAAIVAALEGVYIWIREVKK